MKRDDVIRMAREAGIQHGFDSEGHWDGLTNETIIERHPDSEGTKAYRAERIVEILEPFAALVAAHVRETEFKPDWNKYQQGLADGAAAEREACAKVCDYIHELEVLANPAEKCAAAIRARSNT